MWSNLATQSPNPQSAIRNPQSEKAVVNERISESVSGNSELTGSLTPALLTATSNPQLDSHRVAPSRTRSHPVYRAKAKRRRVAPLYPFSFSL